MLRRAKSDPFSLLVAALLPREGQGQTCSDLREKNGDLIVGVVIVDGPREIEILGRGQKCPGGYVAIDKRPAKTARDISYLRIAFEAVGNRELSFEGYMDMYELLPSGEVGGTIGKGGGPEVAGRVKLESNGRWRILGPRQEGCSE